MDFNDEIKMLGEISEKIKKKEMEISDVQNINEVQQVKVNIHVAYLKLITLNELIKNE